MEKQSVQTDCFFRFMGVYWLSQGGEVVTVYVDLLFGLNTLLNYLFLRGSAAIGGCPAKIWRLLGAAAMGGLYAVAAILPGMEHLQGVLFQFVSAFVMLLISFGWKRSTVKQGLFFFALSFSFGGLVLLVAEALEPDCIFLGGRAYYAVSTPALLLLAGLSYGMAAVVLRGYGMHTGGDIVPVTLELNGICVESKALRDTGNVLRDPVSGQNIPVASWEVLHRLLPDAGLRQEDFKDPAALLQKLRSQYPELRFRLVTYGAVGVSCGLLPAARCRVKFKKRRESMPVAFTATELSAHGQFEILVGGVVS